MKDYRNTELFDHCLLAPARQFAPLTPQYQCGTMPVMARFGKITWRGWRRWHWNQQQHHG